MSKFKRVSLSGSEELFRPTRPRVVEATEDTITEVVERPAKDRHSRHLHLAADEVQLLLDAIQAAKYPERAKPKLPLEKFERYDQLRDKLQAAPPE
ncbi:MAG: hypothetical protein JF888_08395 [Candidatus Dormibacteraeota bacterium]|uniref:Uncharacterized protein n=1 Tax=Candidatus Dormiibacter inghamiae TaxID=3127013 RepID=A0A934KEA8_9BACT|nr:hypothetical protein [Candidatus Dormibacteraeota bacterium]MBJ7607643.1 hypothetical protein [Candidatus Dormibacteraeota bacterium]MDQ6637928.1 hypothetical protein [Candidatus Dormibacteraeota bacterium]MDQ6900318.1 hypothetical protein [Candidatus Dormibacteraeota bacterium]PZR71432.1 MAG: hypothetical protein DLM66_01105 [Candidatus Dormibacteraeota bacterium]